MRSLSRWIALFALLVTVAWANTEKTIFVAPAAITLPDTGPRLADLKLDILSHSSSSAIYSVQRALSVEFPTEGAPQGRESWYLIQDLNEGQRYEVRVCWAAIQPTEFWLDVYNITHVFETPSLVQSLAAFAEEQTQSADSRRGEPTTSDQASASGSVLFLHVRAAADFFSSNATLMQHPPKVKVDLILDPYLANIFPASLLPTAIYIIALALSAWFISKVVWHRLETVPTGKERRD